MTAPLAPPIRVAFCITELEPGGAERALLQLVTRLDRTRWDPHVICLSAPGELVQSFQQARIPVVCLGARSRWRIDLLPRLVIQLRQIRPTILQTYLFHANLLGRVAGRLAGVRHIVSGIRVAEKRSPWYLRLDRWTDWMVTRHICVSQAVRQFSANVAHLDEGKLLVIPNGVDVPRFAEAPALSRTNVSINETDVFILTVGRLDPQKGYDDLIAAAVILKPRYPHLKWMIVGDGPSRGKLEQAVQLNDLAETVHLLGRRDDVPALMKTADLFVFASHWEGMPNVILEAMAARLPIVTTEVEGVTELLTDQVSGRIVPIADPSILAAAVAAAVDDPSQCQQFASIAFQTVNAKHSWDAVAQAYSNCYQEVLHSS